jgi:hypothetical protein
MYQKDFILRMIEMMADLIAGILGLIKKGDFEKAQQMLENTYLEMLHNDAAYFRKIPLEQLTDQLLREHDYTHQHLEILAGLFYTEAELNAAKGDKATGLEYFKKSLVLYEYSLRASKTFSLEMEGRLSYLKKQIGN